MYDMKALYEAYTVEEAVKLRLEHPEAQIIAGGTDVLVQMREGRRAGKELISIQKIDSMRGVSMDEDENIRIGSLTTFSHITRNPIIIERSTCWAKPSTWSAARRSATPAPSAATPATA